MVRGQVGCRDAGARGDRRSRGQALETGAVEGAITDPVVARIADRADMAEFAVRQAVDRHPARDHPRADPRSHGDISDIGQPLARAPPRLRQRRADDVGVEAGGDVGMRFASRRATSVPAQPGLGVSRDLPVVGRGVVDRDRAEAGDPQRGEAPPPVQHRLDRRHRLGGSGRRDAFLGLDRVDPAREDADTFGSAQFDARHQRCVRRRRHALAVLPCCRLIAPGGARQSA